MEATLRARVLMGLSGGLLLAAFLAATVLPAALALGILLHLLQARESARRAFAATTPVFSRRILEPVAHQDEILHVVLDASESRIPAGVTVRYHDELPPAFEALDFPGGEGAGSATFRVRATEKGSQRIVAVNVEIVDAARLWTTRRRVPTALSLQILSSLAAIDAGRRMSRSQPLDTTTVNTAGMLLRELEFESFRAFQPGDTMRDVDWKRVALYGRLLTKTWEREMEASVILLVDASRTMRAVRGDVAKIEHAALLALEMGQAAADRNYRLGLVTFDETGVVDEMRVSRGRTLPRILAQRLASLPSRILARRRLDVGATEEADEPNLDFLEALGRLRGASSAAARGKGGVSEAIDRLVTGAGAERLFVVLFTDFETLPEKTLRAVARLRSKGHRLIVVVLPGTRFLGSPEAPSLRELEAAYREELNRERARRHLRAAGATLLELGPASTAAQIVKAAKGAPTRGGVRR